jgi:hypothetical protein
MSLNSSRVWKKGPYSRGTRLLVRHLAHIPPRTAAPPPRACLSPSPAHRSAAVVACPAPAAAYQASDRDARLRRPCPAPAIGGGRFLSLLRGGADDRGAHPRPLCPAPSVWCPALAVRPALLKVLPFFILCSHAN